MADPFYSPVSFYFSVSIEADPEQNVGFQEVSGINLNMEVESISEGGENRFVHRLPGRTKYENLVLKRGVMSRDAAIAQWCRNTLEGGFGKTIETKSLMVQLLDANNSKPLMSWRFYGAYPVEWTIPSLDAMKNELVVESLEIAYNYFDREQVASNFPKP